MGCILFQDTALQPSLRSLSPMEPILQSLQAIYPAEELHSQLKNKIIKE